MNEVQNTISQVMELIKSDGSPKKSYYVAYIDDEVDLFAPIQEISQIFGFKAYCTTEISSFLSFVEQHQQDIILIISDYKMNTINGLEVRKQIINIAPDIAFFILSAHITKDMALKGIDLKISRFIDKPISDVKFAEIINHSGLERLKNLKEEQELLQCFIEEASSNLEQAEDLALAFENNFQDLEAVNKCFGLVHTLKGSSGYFRPKTLHQFVHRFEDLLKKIQRGEMLLNENIVSTILKSFDFVKTLLSEFKSGDHQTYDLESIFKDFFEQDHSEIRTISEPNNQETKNVPPKNNNKEIINDIKVPLRILDNFMQKSGEMIVIRNMINKCVKSIENQFPRNKDVSMLAELLEELHKINTSVQTEITNLRKIPIRNIIKPITRITRDVAKALSKEVELSTVGEELAVDTAIAAVLNNSIVHLVRNSLDHGLEGPDEREHQGKTRKGNVKISSIQQNDLIQIIIEDDGRGINEESIRKKLIKNKSHTEEQIHKLSKQELYAMIFEAGFSTAEKVTDISGRGVGMSMVKDAVTSLGGHIDIESIPQQGSKFILSMPVPKSVLIRDCLFVSIQGMLYGIPQDNIHRVLRVTPEDQSKISYIQGFPTIHYDHHLVSIVNLSQILELIPDKEKPITPDQILNLIIIGQKDRLLAISVDNIFDIEDTVIKPLQGPIKKIDLYEGAAFMGDATIGLILSTDGILNKAKITSKKILSTSKEKSQDEDLKKPKKQSSFQDLLISLNTSSLYAFPGEEIYRIEEIQVDQIKKAGPFAVVPYRSKILTLIDLAKHLDLKNPIPEIESIKPYKLSTIVIKHHEQFIGFIVKKVIDVTKREGEIIPPISHQFGFSGNYLIDDQTITLINLPEIIDSLSIAA
jgi:two-component system chemotaxis sensor kinase CheA